jgi:hypothetical protein
VVVTGGGEGERREPKRGILDVVGWVEGWKRLIGFDLKMEIDGLVIVDRKFE